MGCSIGYCIADTWQILNQPARGRYICMPQYSFPCWFPGYWGIPHLALVAGKQQCTPQGAYAYDSIFQCHTSYIPSPMQTFEMHHIYRRMNVNSAGIVWTRWRLTDRAKLCPLVRASSSDSLQQKDDHFYFISNALLLRAMSHVRIHLSSSKTSI